MKKKGRVINKPRKLSYTKKKTNFKMTKRKVNKKFHKITYN